MIPSIIPYMALTPALRASKRVVHTPQRLGVDSLAMFGRYNYANAEDGLAEHSHPGALEICYLVRGRQTYCIGKHSYHLRGGDVFLTMPDERHGTGGGPQEKGLLYWMILLNPSSTGGSLLGLAQKESRTLWRELGKSSRRHFPGAPEMKNQLDAILALLHGHGIPLKKTTVQNRIITFLLELLTARERASAEQGTNRFAHIIRHIESHLSEPSELTIDILSSIAGLSPSRFKALFKQKLGIPPAEYALRLRIEEARERLAAGDATVTGVALDLGFSSSQYFASSFKRLTRMTPREAMKISRQKR
jgi:AraC-like DNA-binding protein